VPLGRLIDGPALGRGTAGGSGLSRRAWNARIKDRLERRLQVMVCAGEITLHTARTAIQHDWHAAYRKYVAADPSALPRGMELEEDEVVE